MSGATLPPGLVYKGAPPPAVYTNTSHSSHTGLANSNGVHIVANGASSSIQSGKHHSCLVPSLNQSYDDYFPVSSTQPLQLKQEIGDGSGGATGRDEVKEESQPEVDIVINNVVCSFSVRCHLNLKEIALNGSNVEYRRENGMVTMKLR